MCHYKSAVAVPLLLFVSACGVMSGDRSDGFGDSGSTAVWQIPQNATSVIDKAQVGETDTKVVKSTSYTVMQGDDLQGISRHLTGSAAYWQLIAEHNHLDDPNELAIGDVLSLPQAVLAQLDKDVFTEQIHSKYDLLDALASAQNYDAQFRSAVSNNEIALRNLPIARSAQLTQANVELVAGYYDFSGDYSDEYGGQRLSLSLSQSIYNRANAIAVDQAKQTGSMAELQLQSDQEDLLIRVASNYFNVLKAEAALRYRQSDLNAIREQLQQTRGRYEVGRIAHTDVVEAQAQYDLAMAAEISASNLLATSIEALAVNTGLSVSNELASLGRSIPLESPDPDDVDAWVQTALLNNKQLLLAREQAELAKQQIQLTQAARLPTLGLTGYLSGVDSGNDLSSDISGGYSTGGYVQLGIEVPVLTGGQISAQVAQEKWKARLAGEQMLTVERATVQSTRDTYRGVITGISTVEALGQALKSTSAAAAATKAGYDQGIRTSLDVLQSQRDTFRARSDYSSARYDYVLDLLLLKRASGTLELEDAQRINGWLK